MSVDPQLHGADDTSLAHRIDGRPGKEVAVFGRAEESDRHLCGDRHRLDADDAERGEPQGRVREHEHRRTADVASGPKLALVEGPPCRGSVRLDRVTSNPCRCGGREHLDEVRIDLIGRRNGGEFNHGASVAPGES